MAPILEEPETSKQNLHSEKDIKEVEDLLKTESMKSAKLELENQNLKQRISRLNDNIKKMQYRELMESKLNTTTENFQREIKSLEGTLKKYESENKRLNIEMSRRKETFDNSMIKTTLDSEKRLLESEQRNAKLMTEVITLKSKLKKFETNSRFTPRGKPGNTTMQLNFEKEKEPFSVDESHIQFLGANSNLPNMAKKKNGPDQTLNLSKFLDQDFSILQPGGVVQNEADNFKYDALKRDFDDLQNENGNLIRQIQLLRSELKSKEDKTTEKNLIHKLKIENNEIRKLAEKLQRKNLDLVKEKNDLRFKVDDLKRESLAGSKFGSVGMSDSKVADLEFKIQTLEKTNMDLLKEIKVLKEMKKKRFGEGGVEDLKMKLEHLKEVRDF
jgi:hypothetical protein